MQANSPIFVKLFLASLYRRFFAFYPIICSQVATIHFCIAVSSCYDTFSNHFQICIFSELSDYSDDYAFATIRSLSFVFLYFKMEIRELGTLRCKNVNFYTLRCNFVIFSPNTHFKMRKRAFQVLTCRMVLGDVG